MFVQFGLVEQAALLVVGDQHGLEAVRADFLGEVLGHVGADAFDALGHFDQHRHLGGRFRQAFAVQVGEAAGQFGVGAVDGVLVDVQFDQARLEVQRQGGAIADGFFEAVAAHVAVLRPPRRQRRRRCCGRGG